MVERNTVASFTGQLFEAAASTKKWTNISSPAASIQIVNVDEDSHQIVGLDKDREVRKIYLLLYSGSMDMTPLEFPHLPVSKLGGD